MAAPATVLEHIRTRVGQVLHSMRDLPKDAEGVHACRVGSRRIRVALGLLKAWGDPEDGERALSKWTLVTKGMGPVRDWDVALAQIFLFREGASTDVERAAWEYLETLAERNRKRAWRDLKDSELAKSLRSALKSTERVLEVCALRWEAGAVPGVAWAFLQPRLHAGFGPLHSLAEEEAPEAMHAARTSLKELRYGLEHLAPAFAGDLEPWLGRIRRLQDALGHHHDAVELQTWLHEERLHLANAGRRALAGGLAQAHLTLHAQRQKHYADFQSAIPAVPMESLEQELWMGLGPWSS